MSHSNVTPASQHEVTNGRPLKTFVDKKQFRLRGPVVHGDQLYWSNTFGWAGIDKATTLNYEHVKEFLLLDRATGVDIIFDTDPSIAVAGSCARMHDAAMALEPLGHEVMTALVVSTSHITADENDRLCLQQNCPGENLSVAMEGEHGWLFYIGDADTDITEGLSEGFAGAILYARHLGFDWLRLDGDARPLSSVATYEW